MRPHPPCQFKCLPSAAASERFLTRHRLAGSTRALARAGAAPHRRLHARARDHRPAERRHRSRRARVRRACRVVRAARRVALPVRAGMAPVQSARLVQATAAFVTVATLALLVGEATAPLAGILLATALFGTSAMYEVHLSVLSEPLFLALLALTLAAMVRCEDRPWLAGLFAALAAMTRYAGISAIGAVALWSVARKGTLAERLRRGVWAILPAAVLQGLWFVRTKLVATTESIRELALYGDLGPTIRQGATTLASWLVPDADGALDPADAMPHRGLIAVVTAALLVVIVLAGTLRTLRQYRVERADGGTATADSNAGAALRLLAASALLIVCYLALLIVSRLIADPGIPFDERILAPVIMLGMTIAATGI